MKNIPQLRFAGFEGEWEEKKLSEIGNTYTSLSGKSAGDFEHGQASYVTYMNVYKNPIADLKEVGLIEIDNKQNEVKYGDFFFTTSSETPEEVGLSSARIFDSSNTYLNSFCFGFRPILDIDIPFFAYNFRSENFRKEVVKLAQGSTRFNISKITMMSIKIYFPSKDEQEKIGDLFRKIDALIEKQEGKVSKMEDFKKSMLQKMFPKKGGLVPEFRFDGFDGEWKSTSIKKLGSFLGGTSIESEFNNFGEYKVISIGSYSESSKYIDQGLRVDLNDKTKSKLLKKDDLTMVLNDKTAIGNIIGRVLLIEESDKYVFNQRTQKISPNLDKYNSLFLYYLFNSNEFRNEIKKLAQGNTQIYINWPIIEKVSVKIPSLKEQEKIGQFFKNLDTQIETEEKLLESYKQMKKSLLQKMFV